jgi:outer membrane protein assembly factor BamB
VNTSVPDGETQHLAASSRGSTALGGQVALQWVNSTGTADEVRVRWNKAPNNTNVCVPPPDTAATATDQATILSPSAGVKDGFSHAGLVFDTAYCYSVFVKVGTDWSPGRTVKARPFNADIGPVKWAYATGATAVVPPVVGLHGILAVSNDRTVHALTRGSQEGGLWPALWVPRGLRGVAHSRSPVVPFTVPVNGADTVFFVGDDYGDVQAFDGERGQPVWAAPSYQGKPITGAPGGLFTQYGGGRDLIVIGTRADSGSSALHGLDLATGIPVVAPFTAGDTIGPISGSPAIDYPSQRAYFASRSYGGGFTIWCVDVDDSTPLTLCDPWTPSGVGDVDGSPVLRGNRVYVGDTDGMVHSLSKENGSEARTFATGDGPVKGFVFPDRRNDDLIFATNTKVWSISDDGSATMPWNWQWTVAGLNPSLVLYWPQTNYVYVGSKDGKLYELDFTAASQTMPPAHKVQVLGDGTGQIGAPTLDIGVEPPDVTAGKKFLIVGSESGVLYGVEVPF